ncbi:MAG: DUF2290 domain-containing protein [Xanthobacteraceae bacterium]|nr:DUF2290 domain-containing protein [Xanthobacteraceae bacterium]
MNLNDFNRSIRQSFETALQQGLSPGMINPTSLKSKLEISDLRDMESYTELFKKISDARDLNFFIRKEDFFQFSLIGNEVRYAYYSSPYAQAPKASEEEAAELLALEGAIESDPPEHEIETDPIVTGAGMTLRYEYSENAYCRLSHPCAHIHLGWNLNGRLAVKRKWTPLMFTIFVLRHMHSQNWFKDKNPADADMDNYVQEQMFKSQRSALDRVNVAHFHDFEEHITFLD